MPNCSKPYYMLLNSGCRHTNVTSCWRKNDSGVLHLSWRIVKMCDTKNFERLTKVVLQVVWGTTSGGCDAQRLRTGVSCCPTVTLGIISSLWKMRGTSGPSPRSIFVYNASTSKVIRYLSMYCISLCLFNKFCYLCSLLVIHVITLYCRVLLLFSCLASLDHIIA